MCVDNLVTGSQANIEHLLDRPDFEFVTADVCEPFEIAGTVDAVMDLASPASPKDFETLPLEILDVGSRGVRNLLELASAKDAVFFLASTSEVYGDPLIHPQPESYWGNVNPIGERSVYDEAKRFSEALASAYARAYGLEVRIARIFNTYGPRMQFDDGRVVTNFVHQALLGEPLTLYGDGMQTRSFCYVDDEVTGLLALLDSDIDSPVNIGNPYEVTMRELADFVLELTGSSSPIINLPLPADDPRVRRPDISIARDQLGWEPVVDLREGLARMIAHHRAALAGLSAE